MRHPLRTLTAALARAAAPALLLLAGATTALAGGGIDATIVAGKTQTLNFSPGFSLGCKHEITITISDEEVLCAVNPPASSKGTKFKFQGKKPGIVNVVVEYFASQQNCSGSASVRRNIEVTADGVAIVKDLRSDVNTTRKLLKAKFKTAIKIWNREINDIVKRHKAGELSMDEALRTIDGMEFGLGMWVYSNMAKCLGDLHDEARVAAIDNALAELLPEMQLGSCESLVDDAAEEAVSGLEGMSAKLEARKQKAIKQMEKNEPLRLGVTTWAVDVGAGYDVVDSVPGPDAGDGPEDATFGPRFTGGYAWNLRDDDNFTVSIGYHASVLADYDRTEIQMDISGPNGYSLSMVEPLEALATILAGQDLTDKLSMELARGLDLEEFRAASIGVELIPATGGGEGGPFLQPGNYRIEIRYPDDPAPADTVFITIP